MVRQIYFPRQKFPTYGNEDFVGACNVHLLIYICLLTITCLHNKVAVVTKKFVKYICWLTLHDNKFIDTFPTSLSTPICKFHLSVSNLNCMFSCFLILTCFHRFLIINDSSLLMYMSS